MQSEQKDIRERALQKGKRSVQLRQLCDRTRRACFDELK